MKSNKDKVYDFIKMHNVNGKSSNLSTAYISSALSLQRTNVSSLLNQLVEEGRLNKTNGRPVLYSISKEEEAQTSSFSELVGYNSSLKHCIQLAKAALLYPMGTLNVVLVGEKGTGKKLFAQCLYKFLIEEKIVVESAPFINIDCREYLNNEEDIIGDIFCEDKTEERDSITGNKDTRRVIYLDGIHVLSSKLKATIAKRYEEENLKPVIIVSSNNKTSITESALAKEFPVIIEMPLLSQRTLQERLELINKFLGEEARGIKRTLVVREELMRCLLLYECESNCYQLKGDIKLGCANAYVREYKNSGDIPLYVTDFGSHVRKGFLKYHLHREEIEELIPKNFDYKFNEDKLLANEQPISVTKLKGTSKNDKNFLEKDNIYETINKKVRELKSNGLNEEEINLVLRTEVERAFSEYRKNLIKVVENRDMLFSLVDKEIIDLVGDFLVEAEQRLDRKFSESIFYGLCLHVKGIINQTEPLRKVDKEQWGEILTNYKKEYLLSSTLAEKIQQTFDMEIPVDEILLITLFLCYETPEQKPIGKPVILFSFYGEGIAAEIVKTVKDITKQDNVYAFEIPFGKQTEEIYDELCLEIQRIHQGKGVFVVYDSKYMEDMLLSLGDELGIEIRQLRIPITTVGIELARKSLTEQNVDRLYQEAVNRLNYPGVKQKRFIVTLCSTGKGGAEELKKYIEEHGQLQDTEVIAVGIVDRATVKEEFRRIMKRGTIQCVVGTFNPNIFSIPFISISEVFGVPKDRVPSVLKMEKRAKQNIDYEAMFQYLGEQFKYTNMSKLRKLLPVAIKGINEGIKELSLDTEVGLLVHIACCVERLQGGEPTVKNIRKNEILKRHHHQLGTILKILKPLEKGFGVIIDDDEVANIFTIIFQE